MSIVRIGMGENKKYAEGYAAIFGNKKGKKPAPAAKKPEPKKPEPKKK